MIYIYIYIIEPFCSERRDPQPTKATSSITNGNGTRPDIAYAVGLLGRCLGDFGRYLVALPSKAFSSLSDSMPSSYTIDSIAASSLLVAILNLNH